MSGPAEMLPPRLPDGWWSGHARYRRYVLFAATGGVLWLGALVVVAGIVALGQGVQAWQAYLANLGSAVGVLLMGMILLGTLFFAIRWLRVGVKVATVEIGPVPAPPAPLLFALHYGGLVALTGLLLLILAGVIL